MALRDQFPIDLDLTFIDPLEFATQREFRISDGKGGFSLFVTNVVWDKEMAKKHPLVSIHGIYVGDVCCYIRHSDLPRMPLAGELIYSPANQPWEVLDVTDEESCYRLMLSMTRSQPAHYGNN